VEASNSRKTTDGVHRVQLCVTFQTLPLFAVGVAGLETPKSTMNISEPRKRTSMGLLKPATAKMTDCVFEVWVTKSLTLPLPRSTRATLNPVNVSAPVPVGMEPVSAMKMSPLKPKSWVREKSNILAEPWLSGISAKAGWTFSVARNSSEKANCGHGEGSVGGGGIGSARGETARLRKIDHQSQEAVCP